MRILWICGLPKIVQEQALHGQEHGSQAAWSWIVAHLPPPPGVELHLACLWPGGDRSKCFEFQRATFHLLPCPRRGRALLLFQWDTHYFRHTFNQLKPDVVHGWGTEDSYGLVTRRLAPKRHVIEIQGLISAGYKHFPRSYRTWLTRITERTTLSKVRNIVGESHFALSAAAPLCPTANKRVIEQPLRQSFLASKPSDGIGQNVLFVGTIRQAKGIMDALVAFSQTAPTSWNLHVIGSGPAGDERRMHRYVQDSGISSRFRHSPRSNEQELVRAMQESSVFLLPTRIDSGPTALKEALAMGLWPVCYDNSGPGEYIRKYGFGSLAKNQDIDSLCAELKYCFNELPWKGAEKRKLLAQRTRNDFSREQAWEHLIEFYRMVASAM
jgi:glycosyltransferase involved in cell wall biosynthesis